MPRDDDGPDASAFERIVFANNDSIAYLGREVGKPQQVFIVDIASRNVRRLTSHPADVREFVVDVNGRLRLYSAVASAEDEASRLARLREDGAFLWDRELYDPFKGYSSLAVLAFRLRSARQYFAIAEDGTPKPLYDSRQSLPAGVDQSIHQRVRGGQRPSPEYDSVLRSRGSLTADRSGQFALLYPFPGDPSLQPAGSSSLITPYGLIDTSAGRSERFTESPHIPTGSEGGSGPPLWSPDSRSAIVFTGSREAGQWVEVDRETRRSRASNLAPAGR